MAANTVREAFVADQDFSDCLLKFSRGAVGECAKVILPRHVENRLGRFLAFARAAEGGQGLDALDPLLGLELRLPERAPLVEGLAVVEEE